METLLNFNSIERPPKEGLADVAKHMEKKITSSLVDASEMLKDEYAALVAKILFEKFGSNRQESEPEYLICEAVALAIASRATINGHFEQYEETFLRNDIRSKINIFSDAE